MKWHYADAIGAWHTGTVEKTVDRGGSDVTYFFRSDAGELHAVSGLALNPAAHAVYGPKSGCLLCAARADADAAERRAERDLDDPEEV